VLVAQWGVLGEVLEGAGSDETLRVNVRRLVEHAGALLTRVPEAFRTYTLHDVRHAENVIALMGRLAAPRSDTMTPLEAALLILSAYFHDIGMVYTQEELAAVPADPDFEDFLATHHEEFLARADNGGEPPMWVVVRYCRYRHADRVGTHLGRIDPELLTWRDMPFTDELELICRSHNQSAADLHRPGFLTDFLYEADLRMCAVLLRLADILDLDSSRTPPAVYDHLGLAARATPDEAVSDDEWRKHLKARGFVFPPERVQNYQLQFVAMPDHPSVEHDLRRFLGVIDEELHHCRAVRDVCGDRWRALPLPGRVDPGQIKSVGYKYGEFRFELDRAAVLDLFGGEQLYGESRAFVRELLQNALDAARLRQHLHGDRDDPPRVAVTCWQDDRGHVWFRIDDNGIGMDEDAVRNYLLRVGRSYYRSAEFRADLVRRGRPDAPFGAISRFGIGILSCFMAGDRVEVSTREFRADGARATAIRLSLTRDQDYFVLQQEGSRYGTPMPARGEPEPAFRRSPGTSIAVRIDPHRTGIDVGSLHESVCSYVLQPPVPVTFNGAAVAAATGNPDATVTIDDPQFYPLPVQHRRVYGDRLPYLGEAGLLAVPLTLTESGPAKVGGRLIAVLLAENESMSCDGELFLGYPENDAVAALRRRIGKPVVAREMRFDAVWMKFDVVVRHAVTEDAEGARRPSARREAGHPAAAELWEQPFHDAPSWIELLTRSEADLQEALGAPGTPWEMHFGYRGDVFGDPLPSDPGFAELRPLLHHTNPGIRRLVWSHHGIRLPAPRAIDYTGPQHAEQPSLLLFGHLNLRSEWGPDLTVDRNKIRGIPFTVHSAVHFAVHQAVHALAEDRYGSAKRRLTMLDILAENPLQALTYGETSADPLVRDGVWDTAAVVNVDGRLISVDELHRAGMPDTPGHRGVITLPSRKRFDFGFYTILVRTLLQRGLDVTWDPNGGLRLNSRRLPQAQMGAEYFPPLYAVPYQTATDVAFSAALPYPRVSDFHGPYLNARHPLARWLFANAKSLATDFAAPFQRVFTGGPQAWTDPGQINDLLDVIARAQPRIAPPPEAYLRIRDDGWWVSR
jgi:hypothetical protein